jgi:CheY-like chemotaxis protein
MVRSGKPLKILVLEDDALVLLGMEICLSEVGHEVVLARSVTDALASLETTSIDVASLDLSMDGQSLEVAERLLQNNIPFVFCSGDYPPDQPRFRNVPLVGKPFSETELVAALETAAGVCREP